MRKSISSYVKDTSFISIDRINNKYSIAVRDEAGNTAEITLAFEDIADLIIETGTAIKNHTPVDPNQKQFDI